MELEAWVVSGAVRGDVQIRPPARVRDRPQRAGPPPAAVGATVHLLRQEGGLQIRRLLQI